MGIDTKFIVIRPDNISKVFGKLKKQIHGWNKLKPKQGLIGFIEKNNG